MQRKKSESCDGGKLRRFKIVNCVAVDEILLIRETLRGLRVSVSSAPTTHSKRMKLVVHYPAHDQ